MIDPPTPIDPRDPDADLRIAEIAFLATADTGTTAAKGDAAHDFLRAHYARHNRREDTNDDSHMA